MGDEVTKQLIQIVLKGVTLTPLGYVYYHEIASNNWRKMHGYPMRRKLNNRRQFK